MAGVENKLKPIKAGTGDKRQKEQVKDDI